MPFIISIKSDEGFSVSPETAAARHITYPHLTEKWENVSMQHSLKALQEQLLY